jgi:hypothetical protein
MHRIMVGFTAGDTPALGRVWRITAKKTDFYIDSPSQPDSTDSIAHISAHARNEVFDDHRFHIKIDRQQATSTSKRPHEESGRMALADNRRRKFELYFDV